MGVGPEAPGRQPGHRRPGPGVHRQGAGRRGARGGRRRTARRWPAGRHAGSRRVVRPDGHRARCWSELGDELGLTGRRRAGQGDVQGQGPSRQALAKARTRDSMQALEKLTEVVDGETRFVSDPPLLVPIEELSPTSEGAAPDRADPRAAPQLQLHAAERPPAPPLAVPVRHHRPQGGRGGQRRDPGLGHPAGGQRRTTHCSCRPRKPRSRCWRSSSGKSQYANQGERVVAGQHLMQASSDIFLGWEQVDGLDGVNVISTSVSCGTGRVRPTPS